MPERTLYPCLEEVPAGTGWPSLGPHARHKADGAVPYVDAMADLATAVSAVTALGGNSRPVGATVTSAMSVSSEPPIVGVTLGWQSRTLAAIRTARVFAVNILRMDGQEAARLLGTQNPDKFDEVPWQRTALGTPWLPTVSFNAVECRLVSEIPVGDHALLLGAVAEVHLPSRPARRPDVPEPALPEEDHPLVYWRQKYHLLE